MPRYRAYGLTIDSAIELPELERAVDSSSADLTIRVGPIPAEGLAGGHQISPYRSTTPTATWLHIPRVGKFLITGGHTITVDPDPGAKPALAPVVGAAGVTDAGADTTGAPAPHPDTIRVFVLGMCMGVVLCQRGYLVLHGNAVQVGDACMCAVGASGAGKSTVAAAFWRRGHTVLADDIVAVDHESRALPGLPRIKLWQDSANRLAIDTAPLERIWPGEEKFNVPVAPASAPLPLRWVYILDVHDGPDLRLQPITGLERFAPLHENTYVVRLLHGMQIREDHLKACSRLAGRIRLVKVSRPREGLPVDALIDALAADMAKQPAGG
jgi:hypothetical protein